MNTPPVVVGFGPAVCLLDCFWHRLVFVRLFLSVASVSKSEWKVLSVSGSPVF